VDEKNQTLSMSVEKARCMSEFAVFQAGGWAAMHSDQYQRSGKVRLTFK
jgi:hypothetical protein